jgi:hypothetical protein
MRMRSMIITGTHKVTLRLSLTALVMISFLFIQSGTISLTQAQKSPNQEKMGALTIITTPASYPMIVDGKPTIDTNSKPAGETNPNPTEFKSLLLKPGPHTIKILFPNNHQWVKKINAAKGFEICMELDYKFAGTDQSDPETSPSPNPVQSEDREDIVNITYPNGDKLVGNTDLCKHSRISTVPWWKRILRRTH